MSESHPAMTAQAMTLSFGEVVALNDVSIEVGHREIVGLFGPNGAGKSTLLDAICGHLRRVSGRVTLFGRDASTLGPDRRARLGLGRTYQDGGIFPGLTVREALQVGAAGARPVGFTGSLMNAPWVRFNERALRARADEVVDQCGLGPWVDTLIAHLSTGTRRVCDLAIQLAASSRLLLLDEPTAGLAPGEVESVGRLLRHLRNGVGCSILVVEHDLPFLMSLADRLYAMESGGILCDGPPADVRNHPAVLASYLGPTGRDDRRRPGRTRPLRAAGRRQ